MSTQFSRLIERAEAAEKALTFVKEDAVRLLNRAETAEAKVALLLEKTTEDEETIENLLKDGDIRHKEIAKLEAERDGLREALRGMLELEKHTHRLPGFVNQEWAWGILEDARAALGTESTRRPEGAIVPQKSGEVTANTLVNTDVEARLSGTEKESE